MNKETMNREPLWHSIIFLSLVFFVIAPWVVSSYIDKEDEESKEPTEFVAGGVLEKVEYGCTEVRREDYLIVSFSDGRRYTVNGFRAMPPKGSKIKIFSNGFGKFKIETVE